MAKKENKKKLKEAKKAAAENPSEALTQQIRDTQARLNINDLSPEQMTQLQLEQAIKESNNPSARLKKLKSPFNLTSCLINVIIFVVLTIAVLYVASAIAVDKFSFWTITKDMLEKFGITGLYNRIVAWISGLFKKEEASSIITYLSYFFLR